MKKIEPYFARPSRAETFLIWPVWSVKRRVSIMSNEYGTISSLLNPSVRKTFSSSCFRNMGGR